MKKGLLLLVSLFAGLTALAVPNHAGTPKYTFDSATGALTLNWGEFNKYDNWDYDVANTAVKR